MQRNKDKRRLKIAAISILALSIMMLVFPLLYVDAAPTGRANHQINIKVNKNGCKLDEVSWYWVKDSNYSGKEDVGNLKKGTRTSSDTTTISDGGPVWEQETPKYDGTSFKFHGNVTNHTPFVFIKATAPTGYLYTGMTAYENGSSSETQLSFVQFNGGYVVDVGCYKGDWANQVKEERQWRDANSTVEIIVNKTPITYTVQYIGNGHTGGTTPNSTHTYDSAKNLTANGFTRTGYDFIGWNTKADGTGTSYSNGQSVKNLTATNGGVVQLFGQWTIKKHTMYIDYDGGVESVTGAGTYDYGSKIDISVKLKNHYHIVNVTDLDNGNVWTTEEGMFKGWNMFSDRHIKVNTALDKHTMNIEYDDGVDGSSIVGAGSYDYGTKIDIFAKPKTGYHLVSILDKDSGKVWDSTNSTNGNMFLDWNMLWDRHLYINSAPNQYTITFNPNGGALLNPGGNLNNGTNTNSVKVTYNAGSYWAMSGDIPIAKGHTFKGWYTGGSNQVQVYDANGYCTNEGTYWKNKLWVYPGNVTLYALWTPNDYDYTVNHYLMDLDGVNYTLKDTTTGKAQYGSSFVGVVNTYVGFTSPSSQTITINVDGNTINYYYTRNKYTLNLVKSAGISSVSGAGTYYYGANVNIDAVVAKGYSWSKWTGTYTSTTKAHSFTMPASDVAMTANATPHTYKINYYNGTTLLGSSSHTYDASKNLTSWNDLNGEVINNGYGWTFEGWSISNNSTIITYTDKQSVLNLTDVNGGVINIYAIYKRTITFNHGLNCEVKDTSIQYWNPCGTTNGTHISSIKVPSLTPITNWTSTKTPAGFRQDIKATSLSYSQGSTIYTPVNTSPIYYGVYFRNIEFRSGVNATIKDSSPMQFLNSNNNTVSSITSGIPSTITNWTSLGYRDDTSTSTKEYASNSSIAPAYNTSNTFYAVYSRTLTISYDGNVQKSSSVTGSVANTTKKIYLNAYSTSTSSQEITLRNNGFSMIGFKFTKWDKGKEGASYNPKLAYNHDTFKVVVKALWEHDDSGIGTIKTPSIKVNNPNANGIYYYNGIYFVKGDGKTPIELYGEATLNPMVLSRVDKIALNYVKNPLATNPNYEEKYSLSIPKEDVWNLVYNKDNIVKYNAYSGSFVTYKDHTIVDILQNKLSFTQQFVITGNTLVEPFISSKASCMVKHEDGDDSIHDLYAYGNSVRLQGDAIVPNTYIIDEKSNKVSINAFDKVWTNQSNVTIVLEDSGSGIKSYKLAQGTKVIANAANTTYTTKNTISLSLVEGTTSYTLYVVDNVGNEKTYTFTTNVDRVAPSVEDLITTQGRGNVYTGSNNKDNWPLTSKSTTWEYNWEVLKELKYKAIDDKSGLKLVKITHYGQDDTYTNVWKSVTLVDVSDNKLNMEKEKLIEEFNGDAYLVDGKNYLLIEVEDIVGNKTSVKLVVRRDKSSSKLTNLVVTPVSLESYTIEELNELFSKGDISKFKTNVRFSISDNISTSDTSGIKTIEIVVKDPKTGVELKRYDVTSYLTISNYTLESSQGNAKFSPLVRPLSGTINVNVDTLGDFPKYNELAIYVEAFDYLGNKQVIGGNVIENYSTKSVIYATKDKAYNIGDVSGITNTPYFKTGEVGYIEVWSVGYVDKLEVDFSDGNIGKEMNDAIANGQMDAKYKLGVHGALPSQVRYVTNLSKYKVATSYPDVDGVSFASHISYTFEEVNNSLGASGVDGWNDKGTMIRIPTTHEMVALDKLDKNGNQLYEWETHLAKVYPYKSNVEGNPSEAYYTIWDNAYDDLHYRIIHLFFGN